jgi:hypothetical protein
MFFKLKYFHPDYLFPQKTQKIYDRDTDLEGDSGYNYEEEEYIDSIVDELETANYPSFGTLTLSTNIGNNIENIIFDKSTIALYDYKIAKSGLLYNKASLFNVFW